MLYLLGPLRIEVAPFNVHEVDESGATDFAVKPVVGAEQPLEYVGEGSNEIKLSGRLFPQALGGSGSLELLRQMRASGRQQFLMRGDGRPFGWHAITRVDTGSSFLDGSGVGRLIEVSIALRRAPVPAAGSFFALMRGLLP